MESKKLQNLIKLSCSVKFLIPSTVDVDCPVDDETFNNEVDQALLFMGETFGGATASDALGTWVSTQPPSCGGINLVKEKVKSVESFCSSDDLASNIDDVIEYCVSLKERMKQEAIALLVNNELYFV